MQFIDLKAQYAALKDEINANMQDVLSSAAFIGGKYVKELETQLAAFTGRKHCITCANGTDALQLAFMALGVGEGDAVFAPDMTFISSTEPAKMFGATSVFCDITKDTYTLCPESLEKQIKAVLAQGKLKPKAVVAVDILGNPCDYDTIAPFAKSTASPSLRMPPRPSARPIRAASAAPSAILPPPPSSRPSPWAAMAMAAPSSPMTMPRRILSAPCVSTARAPAASMTIFVWA